MSDMTDASLSELRSNKIEGLPFSDDYVFPQYSGRSILNIPSSICSILDAPEMQSQALHPDILTQIGTGVKRVVMILMDALAFHRLRRWMGDGTAPVWNQLIEDGYLFPLTSIVPSTTSAALTSLWTGATAAQHGIMGYEMWLKEFGLVANMILHKPMRYHGDVGGLSRAGFQPEGFMTQSTLGVQLMMNGVQSHAFQHYSIARSSLSRMLIRDTSIHTFSTTADLWVSVRQLLESLNDERAYVWIYWGAVDGLSHRHGPDDERVSAEFASFSTVFERNFLATLPCEARKDTLLILTADHGQIVTPRNDHLDLRYHPDLVNRLHIQPTGENRLAYMHVRPGMLDDVRDYIQTTWPNRFHVLKSDALLKSGIFGLNDHHPGISDRMGDLIVIARDDSYLWWSVEENPLLGRHGGLSPDEMLVPFLAVRL